MIYFDEFIEGTPKAQPRARAYARGKHVRMYNPNTADAWKMDIKNAVGGLQLGKTPVAVMIGFKLARPKNHYGSRKGVPYLKDSAPKLHTQKPDLDNLAKAVKDAITDAGAWHDDSQVTYLLVTKEWSTTGGASLLIYDSFK
jgi:Holliday junction resolvase RusA-like endonuclease